jgi:hypothetical protein
LPCSEATKIFAQKLIAMFAFRLTVNHAHISQNKVLLSFMARLCCDFYALKKRQAGYQVGEEPTSKHRRPAVTTTSPSAATTEYQREYTAFLRE